jgi:RHS repeat-associated protein
MEITTLVRSIKFLAVLLVMPLLTVVLSAMTIVEYDVSVDDATLGEYDTNEDYIIPPGVSMLTVDNVIYGYYSSNSNIRSNQEGWSFGYNYNSVSYWYVMPDTSSVPENTSVVCGSGFISNGLYCNDPDKLSVDSSLASYVPCSYYSLGTCIGIDGNLKARIKCINDYFYPTVFPYLPYDKHTPEGDVNGDPIESVSGKFIDSITDFVIPGNTMDIKFEREYYGGSFDMGALRSFDVPKIGTTYLLGTEDTDLLDDCELKRDIVYASPLLEIPDIVGLWGKSPATNLFSYSFARITDVSYITGSDCIQTWETVADPNNNEYSTFYCSHPSDGQVSFYDYDGGEVEIKISYAYYHYWWPWVSSDGEAYSVRTTPVLTQIGGGTITNKMKYGTNPYRCPVGRNWTHNYNIFLCDTSNRKPFPECDSSTFRLVSGLSTYDFKRYGYDPNEPFSCPQEPGMLLYDNEGEYCLYMPDGTKWIFGKNKCFVDNITYPVTSIRDRSDNALSFYYECYGNSGNYIELLDSIRNDAGREVYFYYDQYYMLDYIQEHNGLERLWDYDRDSSFDLIEAVSPAPQENGACPTSEYTYTSSASDFPHQLLTKEDPAGNIWLVNNYDSNGRITSQSFGDNDGEHLFSTTYNEDENGNVAWVNATDREGHTRTRYLTETGLTDEIVTQVDGVDLCTDFVYDFDLNAGLDEPNCPRHLKKVVQPDGKIIEYSYNAMGKVTSETIKADANDTGLTTSYQYDNSVYSNLTHYTTPDGLTTEFVYSNDGTGRLTGIILPETEVYDPNNMTYRLETPQYLFEYDDSTDEANNNVPHGLLWRITLPDNNKIWFEYSSGDKISEVDVRLNFTSIFWHYEYDTDTGMITSVTDPDGVVTQYDYDRKDHLTTITNGLDEVVKIGYNINGLVETINSQLGSTYSNSTAITTSFGYTITDKLQTITDSLGRITEIGYNSNDMQKYVEDPQASAGGFNNIEYAYNSRSLLSSITLPEDYDSSAGNQNVTTLDYDDGGRLDTVTDAEGCQTDYNYDNYGRLEKITYPDGSFEQFAYDTGSRITQIRTQAEDYIYYLYDGTGRLKSKASYSENCSANVEFYDESGTIPNWTEVLDPDACGGQYVTTNVQGETLTATLALYGTKILQVRYPASPGAVKYSLYDTYETQPRTPLLEFEISQSGNTDGEWVTLGLCELDADYIDVVVERVSGTIAFDAVRLLPAEVFRYDIMNRLLAAGDNKFSYYNYLMGKLKTETDRFNRTTSYEYYPSGRLKKLTYPDGYYVVYDYDAAGRMKRIVDSNDMLLLEYTRDESGRVVCKETVAGGCSYYDYEDTGSGNDNRGIYLDSIVQVFDGNVVNEIYYTRDLAGNVASKELNNDVEAYFYDKNYWITDVVNSQYHSESTQIDVEYHYDNMLYREVAVIDEPGETNPYTVAYSKSDGRYSAVESGISEKSMSYDGNGNLSFYGSGTAGKHYVYDSENRMVKYYDTTSADEESADVTLYEYDAFGRRISKSAATGGTGTSGALYEACSYWGDRVIAEYNGAGDIRYRYVYGEGIDEVVCIMKTTVDLQPRYFGYFTDHLGSVITLYRYNPLTEVKSIVDQYTYDAYGNVSIDDIDNWYNGNQYMFTGRRYDSESGLYYYRARMYNPELGIFQSQDPLGYIDSMNLYAYCANNPLNYTDPMGECYEMLHPGGRPLPRTEQFPTMYEHYNRNQYNTWQPKTPLYAIDSGWTECSGLTSLYHKMGYDEDGQSNEGNRKFISPSGKCEAVYDVKGKLVTDPVNSGTYNFYNYKRDPLKHYLYDVVPYYKWGNSPSDPTTEQERRHHNYVGPTHLLEE